MRSAFTWIGAAALAALVAGCATPSKHEAMLATPAGEVHKSRESVSVQVAGGKETSAAGTSQISDAAFAAALRESIQKSGLFAKVVEGSDSRYRLEAFIGQLSQPLFGFDMTVTMEVSYTLTEPSAQKKVWQQSVSSVHTATMGDAFAGVTRLRLANEGAARRNIEQAIEAMSKARVRVVSRLRPLRQAFAVSCGRQVRRIEKTHAQPKLQSVPTRSDGVRHASLARRPRLPSTT